MHLREVFASVLIGQVFAHIAHMVENRRQSRMMEQILENTRPKGIR